VEREGKCGRRESKERERVRKRVGGEVWRKKKKFVCG